MRSSPLISPLKFPSGEKSRVKTSYNAGRAIHEAVRLCCGTGAGVYVVLQPWAASRPATRRGASRKVLVRRRVFACRRVCSDNIGCIAAVVRLVLHVRVAARYVTSFLAK